LQAAAETKARETLGYAEHHEMPSADLAGPAGSIPPDFAHLVKEPRKDILRDTAGYMQDIQERTGVRYAGPVIFSPPTEYIPRGEMSPRAQPGAASSSAANKPNDPYHRALNTWSEWETPKGDSWDTGDWQWPKDERDDQWQDFCRSHESQVKATTSYPSQWKSSPNDSYDTQAPWKKQRPP
jgi:hypothetical protein